MFKWLTVLETLLQDKTKATSYFYSFRQEGCKFLFALKWKLLREQRLVVTF